MKNMYPGLEPVVEVDQEELTKKYANCLKLIHLGNYLCTPKVDYSSERKRMLSLERPNFIVVEQRSKKKSQKDSGIRFFLKYQHRHTRCERGPILLLESSLFCTH